jgi:nucleotide exchange factor SIL1
VASCCRTCGWRRGWIGREAGRGPDGGRREEFVPTGEWQEVAEGQAVPGGLHIRSNLATGRTEARLVEGGPGRAGCKLPD